MSFAETGLAAACGMHVSLHFLFSGHENAGLRLQRGLLEVSASYAECE
jgi:hypothetical protein